MTSSRPYLIRALYEWINDNGMTPYLLVDATQPEVEVPQEHVQDNKIILSIAPRAIARLDLGNEAIRFNARFSGIPQNLHIPVTAVQAIYAMETGQGMVFSEEPGSPEPPKPDRPHLKVVK